MLSVTASWPSSKGLGFAAQAGGAYATVEGKGEIALAIDGEEAGSIAVDGPALYTLVEHPRHESHEIALHPSPGLRIWSVSFAAGVP